MRKFVTASVGVVAFAMLAWSAMPPANAMALSVAVPSAVATPVRVPPPVTRTPGTFAGCFDAWLQCVEAAGQAAYCCEHPDANECAKTLKMAPDAAAKLPPELTCKGQFDEDLTECNTDFTACISSVAPAPPAKKQ